MQSAPLKQPTLSVEGPWPKAITHVADAAGEDASKRGSNGKSPAWYTAFYYLAEHFREITNGVLNHKIVYSLVSTEERYINHINPRVRKGAAGALSRIVHSRAYVQHMRDAFQRDESTFYEASKQICAIMKHELGFDDTQLSCWLAKTCWPDVRQGLANETEDWRRDLDTLRLDCEMQMLLDSCFGGSAEGRAGDLGTGPGQHASKSADCCAEQLLSTILYVMAFGHLPVSLARKLVDAQPAGKPLPMPARRSICEPGLGDGVNDGASVALGVLDAAGANCDHSAALETLDADANDDEPVMSETLDATDKNASNPAVGCTRACVVRFSNPSRTMLSGFWEIPNGGSFSIGRYTDCNAIELSPAVSRVHCVICCENGIWRLRSADPSCEVQVRRNGKLVAAWGNAEAEGGPTCDFPLEFGDEVELPSGSVYLFAAMDGLGQF